ncbi:MAG: Eco57I restriction-modification methylase domain-containing protein, partial [Leptospiraceae bacterium]|nr:Eco57I restriction-modification methylase domain-containing protein [Leptospiraceae bacterium]
MSEWNPYDVTAVAPWFDPEYMFEITDGFDIVLGNPPYVQLQKSQGKLRRLYENQKYETLDGNGDIYTLFYERGVQILKEKGILCYITSNKWMRTEYGKKLRKFFTNYNPLLLIDLGAGVFENASVDTNILLLQKATVKTHNLKALNLEKTKEGMNIQEQLQSGSVNLNKLTERAWFIANRAELSLKEKIEKLGKPLKDWDVNIYFGIKTGLNEAFIISTEKKEEILKNCKSKEEKKRTEEIIKPLLRGRDIKRYHYEWEGLWLIVIPAGWTNENRRKQSAQEFIFEYYPSLMNYLNHFEKKAKKRDDKGDYWWELRGCTSVSYTH